MSVSVIIAVIACTLAAVLFWRRDLLSRHQTTGHVDQTDLACGLALQVVTETMAKGHTGVPWIVGKGARDTPSSSIGDFLRSWTNTPPSPALAKAYLGSADIGAISACPNL